MSEDYLAHHGVLGMKWGVRRYQPYGGGTYEPEHRGRFVGKNGAKGSVSTRRAIKKQYRADVRKAHAGYNADVKSAAKRLDATYDPKKYGVRNNPQMTKYAADVHKAEAKRDKAISKAEQKYRDAKTAQKQSRMDEKAYNRDYKKTSKAIQKHFEEDIKTSRSGNKRRREAFDQKSKNRRDVERRMEEEVANSREAKELSKAEDAIGKKFDKYGGDAVFTDKELGRLDEAEVRLNAKTVAVAEKYVDSWADATLKDLGISSTAGSRQAALDRYVVLDANTGETRSAKR